MGRDLKNYPFAAGARLSWGVLGALLVLLGYICLPLINYHHLSRFPPVAVSCEPGDGSPLALSQSEKPYRPDPKNKTRPICKGSDGFQDCGLSASWLWPDGPCRVGFLCLRHLTPSVSFVILPASSPRSPPLSL
jgi:hypothetical protein